MSVTINTLKPEFRVMMEKLISNCSDRGITMRLIQGLRSPAEQAKLWRQSRSWEKEIKPKINHLRSSGLMFIPECLITVGPQNGPPVTNALPGLSWHQWGESGDCVWIDNDKVNWSTTQLINGTNGYKIYAEEARKLGLTAGGYWRDFPDWPHVQLRADASPLAYHTMKEIDAIMAQRFQS